jgi:hypothetical protein
MDPRSPSRGGQHDNRSLSCGIDFNLDDRVRSICSFVGRLTPLLADSQRPWELDLSACDYLGPFAGAIIVASLLDARSRKQDVSVRLPTGSRQLQAFCEFSGLRHYATGSPFPTAGHPRNVTIPMRPTTRSSLGDPDPIVSLIRSHVEMTAEGEEYLRICLNEVIQNVEDHAQSGIGAITAARFMSNRHEIRVAVVDRGLGIATTLRAGHPGVIDARDALARVILGGASARSRPNNMGVGISNLCSIVVEQLKGELFIISEDGFAEGKTGRRPISHPLNGRFPGTGVFFTVPVPQASI